jgi:adenine deaminase
MDLLSLLSVARGDTPADLVLKYGRIVNVFTGEIEEADIAILGDRIAGVGKGYEGKQVIDLAGQYVAPGLIDAHVHIESSLCLPAQFARAVVPRGVTTVIADPHEIANVAGQDGVRFMYDASRGLPLRVEIMAPSCVPATPMATTGGRLTAGDLSELRDDDIVHGLAEVMNFPGVILGDAEVAAKLNAFRGRPIDGHAPGVSGKSLSAYAAAGVGSDHECVSVEEAREKLSRGLYLLIREATNAHNLHTLLPAVTPANTRRICFCTDDRQPADLLAQGSIDYMVREAIAFGINPVDAIRMATLNTAEWFNLPDRGGIAPGRFADLFTFTDLAKPQAARVWVGGREATFPPHGDVTFYSATMYNVSEASFRVPAKGKTIRVIGSLPDQLVTDHRKVEAKIIAGHVESDHGRDILKMAVVERHHNTGNIGLGFIHGFGLQRGAIAGTVAHDHHNLVIVGVDDASMALAAKAILDMGGGLVAVADGKVLAKLPLPIAGLMSDRPIEEVRKAYDELIAAARSLGSGMHDPFMAMSFMALEVIPNLKLTDLGLVDVERFQPVDLFVS